MFFLVSRISISFEVYFVLMEREGLTFVTSLVTVHCAETCGHTWLGEENMLAARSSSPTLASPAHTCVLQVPALDTQQQPRQRTSAWGSMGGAGGSCWGRGAACTPSLLEMSGPSTRLAAVQLCLQQDTATTALLQLRYKPKELQFGAGPSIPPRQRTSLGQVLSSKHSLAACARAVP